MGTMFSFTPRGNPDVDESDWVSSMEAELENKRYLDGLEEQDNKFAIVRQADLALARREERLAARAYIDDCSEKLALAEFDIGWRNKRTLRDPRLEAGLREYLWGGVDGMGRWSAVLDAQTRALAMTGTAGYLAPATFHAIVTESAKQYDGIFDAASVFETNVGTPCPFPLDDDTSAVASIVAENSLSVSTSPLTFDRVPFDRCPTWRSGHVVYSRELAQDAPLFVVTLAVLLGRRFARGIGAAHTATLLSEADVAVTSASPTSISCDEVLDLMGSLDSANAQQGAFLMTFGTYISLMKTKSGAGGVYMTTPTRDAEGYPMLFGSRVYLSPSMPAIGAANKAVAFGRLSAFTRREVFGSMSLVQYNERYADSCAYGTECFWRVDGHLARAANSPVPVRLLACHA